MQNYAITHNLTPFISMQNHYNVLYREEEREMMPTLKHFGVASIPWSPLARGAATHPVSVRTLRSDNDRWHDTYLRPESAKQTVGRIEELAKKHGRSMAQVSLAWVLSKDVVTAPIIGTTSLDKLKELIDGLDLELTEEEVKYLDAPYQPVPLIGHA
ncbi:hypothetical protein EVG20_g5439 [Dentipellis fragilis]|uniref:NADP-dependent oxidoreductase domain-containing protein n=1 Tax=Dentipellis fragilis TaxID=205917 RepID=A0A4Y9YVA3_9AGAM|nr:hypothetical protein EVG20_g5439 [Dentipellis fragilis]